MNKITPATNENNILIVDDTPENPTVLRQMLTANGYRARPAINGAIALKTIQTSPPDLILLDIMMDCMDGFEVCRRLKSDVSPYVSLSMGICTMIPDRETLSTELVAVADRALYLAQKTGRDRVETVEV